MGSHCIATRASVMVSCAAILASSLSLAAATPCVLYDSESLRLGWSARWNATLDAPSKCGTWCEDNGHSADACDCGVCGSFGLCTWTCSPGGARVACPTPMPTPAPTPAPMPAPMPGPTPDPSPDPTPVPTPSPSPSGGYAVNDSTIKGPLPGLNQGPPYSAIIFYPTPKQEGEKFPVLSFAHATYVGSMFGNVADSYRTILELVTSMGFIIVAPESCPAVECYGGYPHDQLAALEAVKNDPSLHPSLATADTFCADECADQFYANTDVSKAGSKVLFNIKGASHFEPSNRGDNSEKYAIAYFFSWVRGEYCDKVYGSSGAEICNSVTPGHTMAECKVDGAGPMVQHI